METRERRSPAGRPGIHKGTSENSKTKNSTPARKTPTKKMRVLAALASGKAYNRFEASRELADWCLHSTVAELEHSHGINVHREYETVPGRYGTARVCRYRLLPAEIPKARKVLAAAGLGEAA